MGRLLRRGVLFTLLFAGLVAPAAADPILMLLMSIARQMVIRHAQKPDSEKRLEVEVPDLAKYYPGTLVEPDQIRRVIDESFLYLDRSQREEIFDSLNAELMNPKNAAVRIAMIEYFTDRALILRSAQLKLSQMAWSEKERMAREFKAELAALPPEEQAQIGELLRKRMLPVPSDLNQLLLAALEAR